MWSGIRTFADLMHLLSFVIIIYHIIKSKSCAGVSLKTQEIYLIVFCARYMDLFMYFISLYNTTMKIAFISSTVLIIYLMRFQRGVCEVRNLFYFLDI